MNKTVVERFKEQLIEQRDYLRDEIRSSIDALPEEVRPVGEHDREPSQGWDQDLALERRDQSIYQQINSALERMDEGTYGQCVSCGKRIPFARLEAIPYTPYCIDCERKVESEQ